jgi:predicted Rossmann fold nucleotide-binding protein DprA/Smf involved in DNA uptake
MAATPPVLIPTLFPREEQLNVTDAITITGARQFLPFNSDDLFEMAFRGVVGHHRTWLLGGAIGVDQLATEWLVGRGERVIVVVPFTVQDQPKSVQSTLAKVPRIIELQYKKSKKAYLDRNAFMVERSDTVIAFWNGEKGGTWATLQLALKLHRQVHVYPV